MSTVQFGEELDEMDTKEHSESLLPVNMPVSERTTTVTRQYKNYFFVFVNGAATVAVVFLNKMYVFWLL